MELSVPMLRSCFTALVLILTAASPAAAAGAIGLWATEAEKSHVRIEPCGERLCGIIVWLKEPNDDQGQPKRDIFNQDESQRDRAIVGLRLLSGFETSDGRSWSGGRIYNPEDGKTYKSKLSLQNDRTLKVEGCVLIFCKSQIWTRVE